jgi:hypothetical protein
MLVALHKNKKAQVVLGLFFGIAFGFLLQKVVSHRLQCDHGTAPPYRLYSAEADAFCHGIVGMTDFTSSTLWPCAAACGLRVIWLPFFRKSGD